MKSLMRKHLKKIIVVFVLIVSLVAGLVVMQQRLPENSGGLVSAIKGEEFDPHSKLRLIDLTIRQKRNKESTFRVEVAEKPVDIQVGLMFRPELERDRGMIFLMGKEPKPVSFWMKNTLVPLDMLFIDEHGKIVNIHYNAKPRSTQPIPSRKPVTAVLEIKGGEADSRGISIGDTVVLDYFDLQDEKQEEKK